MINEIIKSIGIEVECGTYTTHLQNISKKYYINTSDDSSVKVRKYKYINDSNEYSYLDWKCDAEIKYCTDNYNQLMQFIDEVFKQKYLRQNNSCGNHIHIQFSKPIYFTVFFTLENIKKFQEIYSNTFTDHKYQKRLTRHHCSAMYDIQHYIDNYEDNRYYSINVQCNRKHNTYNRIEVRLMPYAKTKKEYKKMIDFVINTVTQLTMESLQQKEQIEIQI
jgi:hypothetical protein